MKQRPTRVFLLRRRNKDVKEKGNEGKENYYIKFDIAISKRKKK